MSTVDREYGLMTDPRTDPFCSSKWVNSATPGLEPFGPGFCDCMLMTVQWTRDKRSLKNPGRLWCFSWCIHGGLRE